MMMGERTDERWSGLERVDGEGSRSDRVDD